MDDLCGSIVDGRFREQKFRMKRCGLRNRIYLVEDCSFVKHLSLPESTLQQAIVNTQVNDAQHNPHCGRDRLCAAWSLPRRSEEAIGGLNRCRRCARAAEG
ncbi:hypothetical protein scyTo_0026241 [Scyliorhinus torazame]|uniref:Crossover junction endonuclease MUS81 n=1 Tax=Scyliorhinus torazame TaxID=75743 RepID=A0A401QJP2_SCYTO|nr:hypothetical protein [Scyliorhinus torazame]